MEKLGRPVTFIVAKGFEFDANLNAKAEGLTGLSLIVLPLAQIISPREIEELELGKKVADQVITALTQRPPSVPVAQEQVEEILTCSGKDYAEAVQNMQSYFEQRRWSDGLPLLPPTEEAVNRMLQGTRLPPDHVVALVEPGGGKATVEKIAINAVMAGCLPQYMPVVLAAIEAITDPMFDLRGVQCTAGLVSPLLIVSGAKLIKQLDINDSFSTLGPGWRANSAIGRAVRLVMINIGHAWPGNPDMKSFGSPFKYVMFMAENEGAYGNAWEPIRVVEGYHYDETTISAMPAVSWQVEVIYSEPAAGKIADARRIIELLGKQGKAKYDSRAENWGMDNLVLISPTAFDIIRKERQSRIDLQKALYEEIQLPCCKFFDGKEPSAEQVGPTRIPDWLVERCKADSKALAPLLLKPESIKIVVAGAPGPGMLAYIGTWGYGPSYFVTKPIRLPKDWENLLEKYKAY